MGQKKIIDFFDYRIYTASLDQLPFSSKTLIHTINPYSFLVAENDRDFKEALRDADVLLPDGIGVVMGIKMLRGIQVRRITGSDLHDHLLKRLHAKSGRCFYLGSSPHTLDKIRERLAAEFANIQAGFYSPPFAPCFSEEQNDEMIRAINAFQPDILFVGMTAPKQEKWVNAHKYRIQAKVICSIGAVFDFYAGTQTRADQMYIRLGLEWLDRLLKEPRRLWKRTVYYAPLFVGQLCKARAEEMVYSLHHILLHPQSGKNVLILGYNNISKMFVDYALAEKLDINIVGFCEERKNVLELTPYPVICGIAKALEVARALNIGEIYSAISPQTDPRVHAIMQQADLECIRFRVIPDFSQFIQGPVKLSYVKNLPVLTTHKEPLQKRSNRLVKRLMDVAFSILVLLFILTWLTPVLALCICLESPGPIFFTQFRCGRNKRPFRCLKFRSMRVNKEADVHQAKKDDPRFTRVGKFIRQSRLDEFPQFINVLLGDMSLVGPRPHMLKDTNEFSKIVSSYGARHFIKPGITGWAQLKSYHGEITHPGQVVERTNHDIWYLENWSLWLDLRILFATAWNMLKGGNGLTE